MGLYSGGLIIARISASEIWGGGLIFGRAYVSFSFFFFGGGAYYRNFTVFSVVYRLRQTMHKIVRLDG